MQFNDTTNKNGLIQMIERTTGLGLASISGDAGRLAYFTELINTWLYIAQQWARMASGEFFFDDRNQTDFPILTAATVDNQSNYSLETDTSSIRRVEIRATLPIFTVTIASPAVFTSEAHGLEEDDVIYLTTTGALPTGLSVNTAYYVIATGLTDDTFQLSATEGGSAINSSDSQSGVHTFRLTENEEFTELTYRNWADRLPENNPKGTPSYFYFLGRSLFFDVPVDTTKVDRFRLTTTRDPSVFTVSDTTKVPGIAPAFHPILYYGPSMEWAKLNHKDDVVTLCQQMLFTPEVGLKALLEDACSQQNRGHIPAIKRKEVNYS